MFDTMYGHNGGYDVREVPIVLSFGFLLPSERGFEQWMRILINKYI